MRSSSWLALLAVTVGAQEYNATLAEVANLEHYFEYGRSPPVYPSPQGAGLGDWAESYAYARNLVSQMTNEEKQNITIGVSSTTNGCSGNSGNVSRLGFPGLCLNDAGNGVRGTDGTNGYAAGVSVGASWNRNLAYDRAHYMGAEFKAKGVNQALGPVVGPLGRVAEGGRNWEGFSNDPYLSGQLTYETIIGMQESVIATVKHFIGYEQETNRNPSGLNASVSSNIDDKAMHELYLWPFADAVRAGTGSVMCSYNQINGSYACQNSKTQNGLLKTELGFEGFIVSDWGGQHSGVASAQAGLDMAMPQSTYWSGNLTLAVNNGSLPQARLDDMATRIIAAWHKLNPLPNPGHGMPKNLTQPHAFVNGRNPDSKATILQGAIEGHVLVKNVNNALPLHAPPALSLFGYDATAPLDNSPTAYGSNPWSGGDQSINNSAIIGSSFGATAPEAAYGGTLFTGGGSGATQPAYINAPYDAFQQQAYEDGTWLAWDFVHQDPAVEGASSACIVMVNEFATEGYDRPGLADPYSDTLIQNVAVKCNNTIVVIHNAGIRLVDAWIENPNITAVVYAHLPGQDSGRALVQLLYGKQSFSGRLPYTVAKDAADYGDLLAPTVPTATSEYYTQSNFTEGVYIDYRSFIARNITPRFDFGFGLTYSTFAYSNLETQLNGTSSTAALPPQPQREEATTTTNNTSSIPQGGIASLYDIIATASVTVTNTGTVAAADVPQLYIGIPNAPEKQLRGFAKESLQPGGSCVVTFELTRRDLSVWDTVQQSWVLQKGDYAVSVGSSVLNTTLKGSLTI